MGSTTRPLKSVHVSPRRAGDPTPDLTGIRLGHRAMVTDSRRIAEVVTAIGEGRLRCTATRARAICRYVDLLCESIHHHHTTEDEVLWPLIQASAGEHVDLSELTADHAALEPRLEHVRARAAELRRSGGDAITAASLGAALTDLHTMLAEHIVEEEREVFPVITAHVSVGDWQAVEKAAQKGGRMSFDGPRAMAVMTDDERAQLAHSIGPVLRIVIGALSVRHRRLERTVFG
ncbi:hemerythrin domain-containing protein [Mycobacterium sp. MYCO198283]|uniref:hemerythrin domain-containing protein n=1 Tax=Mycobacterium sp. MYCO198283 TaxID=2883505 RepID=UPI001E64C2F8|nr:hemerythrin domain-containing protein [Mycobacterium sp. MYCO198283]MCG5432995.1 hemerythrin domain-containing protein [Mycobacterium sp. MYCO198283]